jgi:hypothetical protein
MFGTLVVQLPVDGGHSGGVLRVRHKGKEFTCDFAKVGGCRTCVLWRGRWLWVQQHCTWLVALGAASLL